MENFNKEHVVILKDRDVLNVVRIKDIHICQ